MAKGNKSELFCILPKKQQNKKNNKSINLTPKISCWMLFNFGQNNLLIMFYFLYIYCPDPETLASSFISTKKKTKKKNPTNQVFVFSLCLFLLSVSSFLTWSVKVHVLCCLHILTLTFPNQPADLEMFLFVFQSKTTN